MKMTKIFYIYDLLAYLPAKIKKWFVGQSPKVMDKNEILY